MTDLQARDLVFSDFFNTGISPDFRFKMIIQRFEERQWRYDPDVETDLVDEIYRLAQNSDVKWYDGGFYVFDGKIYVKISEEVLMSAFKLWMSRMGMKINQKRKKQIFKDELIPHMKLSNKLNPRLDIVAFKNGILDLSDESFHDFDKKYHCTYFHPYKYEPNAKCTKWIKFLKEVLPDKTSRTILQMFLGLGLIERGTVYNECEGKDVGKVELCLILLGGGANGKSVIYQTAMGLFGKNRISGIDYDELVLQGDEGMRARRLLRDAIFNWSSDSDSRTFGRKRTGVFKRIVSGEPVTDRVIGGNVETNYKMPYLIFNLNDLPYPEDTSLGFIRRLQFVTFDVTIPASKQNKTLALELTKEYPGIFNWVLRGTKEIRRRKFQFPQSEGNTRQMILAQMRGNPVVAWVNAYKMRWEPGVLGEQGLYFPTKMLYNSLEQFCEDNDAECPSKQMLGSTLGRLNFTKKRTAGGYEYMIYGLSVKDLNRPFIVRNESFIDDAEVVEEESATFINQND